MSDIQIALIGYGEVGQTIASDLRVRGINAIRAFDVLFSDSLSSPSLIANERNDVLVCHNLKTALSAADVIISAVTAAECSAAAHAAAALLQPSAFWLDLNSVAPATKIETAAAIEQAGARYVEAAIMSPIATQRIASPILLGGQHATAFAPVAARLGFTGIEVFSESLGTASAAKMCRSVMIKGIEALLTESLLAARHYGVESTVLASLRDLFPSEDWPRVSQYMISRSLQHGRRRAEEMREVARTVADAGLDAWMSLACAERQDWAANHGAARHTGALESMLDTVLAAREKRA